jgi:beta-phosphoglucomutase
MIYNSIFFDFDGVVIDSEPVHAKAKQLAMDKYKISYPARIFDDYKGRPDDVFFDYVSKELSSGKHSPETLYSSKKAFFEEIVGELRMIDGFLPFLEKVKAAKIKTAMVSSTSLYSFGILDKTFNMTGMFDIIITEVDTEKHKPEPDPYLKAIEKLKADRRTSLVIEDSPNGIISAKKAGLTVFAITTTFTAGILRETDADLVFDNYEELAEKLKL